MIMNQQIIKIFLIIFNTSYSYQNQIKSFISNYFILFQRNFDQNPLFLLLLICYVFYLRFSEVFLVYYFKLLAANLMSILILIAHFYMILLYYCYFLILQFLLLQLMNHFINYSLLIKKTKLNFNFLLFYIMI